jgi:DNA invertase Pin-like site-specific DNA recombinase
VSGVRHDEGVRVIGYARVSTEEQGTNGASLPAQESMIREEARRRGWDLLTVYSDVASGKSTTRRPGLADAVDALEGRGPWEPKPHAIVVVRLDRLSRSSADAGRLFDQAKRKGWAIIALDLGVDTTTAAGRLVANVMIDVSQWEREVIGERTREGLAQRRREGVRLGRPRAVDGGDVAAARARATLARLMELRAQGLSYRKVADQLNEEGYQGFQGGRWHERQVRRTVAQRTTDATPAAV